LIREVIARRRAQSEASRPNDLLSKLMLARDEETGEMMSDVLVRDESLGIFVAGHETTARTMSFLWWALHEKPAVAERLYAELDAVVPRDAPPTLEHLKRLPYTLRTIKEVLRLYPPSPLQPRDPVGSARAPLRRAARRRSHAPDRDGWHVDGAHRATDGGHRALTRTRTGSSAGC
jgi:cytochrome P450